MPFLLEHERHKYHQSFLTFHFRSQTRIASSPRAPLSSFCKLATLHQSRNTGAAVPVLETVPETVSKSGLRVRASRNAATIKKVTMTA